MKKKFFALSFFVFLSFSNATFSNATSLLPKIQPDKPLPANIFARLAEVVNPAVVNISTSQHPSRQMTKDPRDYGYGYGHGHPLHDLLERLQRGQVRPAQSLGSGFIIKSNGLIITNNHVIAGADVIRVQLEKDKNKFYEAEVIGGDERSDIALIKIKTNKKLPVVPLGDSSKLKVGEWVAAFGNPYGHGHSMSKGIISAKGRDLDEINRLPFLQTDASINPGNSGGPLVNLNGEVIGVNTAIDARAQGIGFAIPINDVKSIVQQIQTHGQVQRGYLGIYMKDLSFNAAQALKLKNTHGIIVTQVIPNSPAARAGIEVYDVIINFNGKPIRHSGDVVRYVKDATVGKAATVQIVRNGTSLTKKITITPQPRTISPSPPEKNKKYYGQKAPYNLGFKVSKLTRKLAQAWNINPNLIGKLVVVSIRKQSLAAKSGLQIGDVIIETNRKSIRTAKQLIRSLDRKSNLLRVVRGKYWQIIFLNA